MGLYWNQKHKHSLTQSLQNSIKNQSTWKKKSDNPSVYFSKNYHKKLSWSWRWFYDFCFLAFDVNEELLDKLNNIKDAVYNVNKKNIDQYQKSYKKYRRTYYRTGPKNRTDFRR